MYFIGVDNGTTGRQTVVSNLESALMVTSAMWQEDDLTESLRNTGAD